MSCFPSHYMPVMGNQDAPVGERDSVFAPHPFDTFFLNAYEKRAQRCDMVGNLYISALKNTKVPRASFGNMSFHIKKYPVPGTQQNCSAPKQ